MLKYNFHLIDGLYFELLDTLQDKEYHVKFVEEKDGHSLTMYETDIKKGMWTKIPRKYLGDYWVEIWDKGFLRKKISFLEHMKDKKVFISFESKSIGDTIAWMPYCQKFKETYGCEVVVSTFMNDWFEDIYPELTFVPRGFVVNNIIAMIEIGWFYESDKEPVNPATIPLQKAATNILNLEFEEVLSKIHFVPKERPIEEKYICIATHSTSGLKYWTNEGWQELINHFIVEGYKIIEISKDDTNFENCLKLDDKSIPNTMNYIHHSEYVIGLSSGLSWLSWALGKQVVMISNFTEKDHEFTINCVRIYDEQICHGCWNNPKFKFDKGNWWYCPEHEDTPKQFECHKLITATKVIDEIKKAGI